MGCARDRSEHEVKRIARFMRPKKKQLKHSIQTKTPNRFRKGFLQSRRLRRSILRTKTSCFAGVL
jgi:hypothetical protein